MTLTDTMPGTDRLFPKFNEHQMQCAVDAGEELHLGDREVIFREGQARADFYVILNGRIKVVRHRPGGEEEVLTIHERGDFTGTTDLLSGEAATATGYALGPARVAHVPVEHFNELILACPEMRELLLPALAERRRAEYAITAQQQKLAALGKMSAGLAHELNNPAAAAQRAAQTLGENLKDVESLCCDLLNCLLGRQSNGAVPLTDICELAKRESPELDPLTRSEREDELSAWLATMKVEQPWEAAAALVSAGLARKDLEPLAGAPPALVPKLLTWLAKDIEMRQTCRDLGESTGRITEIVCAMKSYSHMDQSPVKSATDLNQGILTTGTILKHKAKKKDLKWEKQFGEVPPVLGIAGELNQVWTNLLDNAIDASPVGGTVRIRTAREGDQALVEITDQGPGIPPELRSRIFEPFFTTKPVGQGTGLGLDTSYRIVQNHRGDIQFDSRPGETRFTVRLPLS
jgi:signal transduction histidine kinase